MRRSSFGCGLRPLIWACDVVTFSDSYGAARGVGCARNCKVRQAQQLCVETRHGSCGSLESFQSKVQRLQDRAGPSLPLSKRCCLFQFCMSVAHLHVSACQLGVALGSQSCRHVHPCTCLKHFDFSFSCFSFSSFLRQRIDDSFSFRATFPLK